jgi:hypothetical protein
MMTKDEALRMAIQALEEAREQLGGLPPLEKLIQDCKEALEQPAQKHETWIDVNDKLPEPEINFLSFSKTYGYQVSMYSNNPFNSTLLPTFERLKIDKWMPIPVYTLPHQWQGLTDNEMVSKVFENDELLARILYLDGVSKALKQTLKEMNDD